MTKKDVELQNRYSNLVIYNDLVENEVGIALGKLINIFKNSDTEDSKKVANVIGELLRIKAIIKAEYEAGTVSSLIEKFHVE